MCGSVVLWTSIYILEEITASFSKVGPDSMTPLFRRPCPLADKGRLRAFSKDQLLKD
jgi:hypothetical protein